MDWHCLCHTRCRHFTVVAAAIAGHSNGSPLHQPGPATINTLPWPCTDRVQRAAGSSSTRGCPAHAGWAVGCNSLYCCMPSSALYVRMQRLCRRPSPASADQVWELMAKMDGQGSFDNLLHRIETNDTYRAGFKMVGRSCTACSVECHGPGTAQLCSRVPGPAMPSCVKGRMPFFFVAGCRDKAVLSSRPATMLQQCCHRHSSTSVVLGTVIQPVVPPTGLGVLLCRGVQHATAWHAPATHVLPSPD